jgi:DMSO/TMAO reductase YedYZ molybdopterin-dependent catalytic subunit
MANETCLGEDVRERSEMRTAVLLTGYRRFAAQTHLAMALLAVALVAAIGFMVVAGAQAAHAAFLDAEARNFATLVGGDDSLLIVVVGTVFLAAFASLFVRPGKKPRSP